MSVFFVRYTLADIHQCLLKLHQQHVAAEEYPQQAMRCKIVAFINVSQP